MGVGQSKHGGDGDEVHVVVIGGGYGGVQAAVSLKKAGVSFTIVDPKEYFHHCFAALRVAVNPEDGPKVAIPLKDAFGDNFVQDNVEHLDMEGKKVVLAGGREIKFSHCVIAVGSLGPAPARSDKLTIYELLKEYDEVGTAIEDAEKIVIVGGGAVGVEFAGEIVDKYKKKDVTIISNSEKLVCQDFDDKFYSNLQYYIDAAGVKVVYGRVSNLGDLEHNKVVTQTVIVGDSTELESDLVLSCVGLPPNKRSINKLVNQEYVDENNRIKVTEFLSLPDHPSVFAIGDCSATPGHKLGVYAMRQAELVVANIIKEISGSWCHPTPWTLPFVGMLIPFGASKGSATAYGLHIPNFVATFIKYRDLGNAKIWGMVGLEVPK